MHSPPPVSIGLPVYNAERYLPLAIESHLSQSFGDFELIISDNGSTDGTREICREYAAKDRRIRYFREEQNRGLSWNHARVFELSRSELFRWSAADDIPSPGLLAELVEILRNDPSIVLCVPHTKNIDDDGAVIGELPRTLDLQMDDAFERARAVLTRGYQMVFHQGLIRREALLATSRRWNYFGWDFILLFELALQGKIAMTRDAHLLRRLHRQQASRVQRDAQKGVRHIEPTFGARFVMPHWRWATERLRAALAAPLPVSQRMRIGLLVLRHAWWARTALAADVRASLRLLFGRSSELPL
jgi:Glycosyltransferases involved in cell wall biogenesis|nr:MAG: glycosyltransferase family 2 protein [Pseudomonadota bacterium]